MNDKHPIVLVDDDADDRLIFVEGFVQGGCSKSFLEFDSGPGLIEYLSQISREEMPSMILLDLNMPQVDGREILKELKQNAGWSHIPVVVFTTSALDRDREVCYKLGANCFVTKPSSYQDVLDITKSIALLWCLNA